MDTSDSSPPNIAVFPSEVQFLKTLLDGELQHYRALVELSNLAEAQKPADSASRQPLVEKLNYYPAKGVNLENLVTYPPSLEPIPVKPLFFDAAWNYIEYPGREIKEQAGSNEVQEVAAKGQTAEPQQKKGWFGFGR